ncbi:angio-associated migratory cell protein-like [Biomphalaria glabrata]|uniref:Angio-associated migratory cell protein n=1 Tax=Biomphalaria glabrata TaxID=6526 RepID=A0A9W2Z515_BIOGL|nr:angio-associated migratory cell protein-like [Biomphalaria glabrata]
MSDIPDEDDDFTIDPNDVVQVIELDDSEGEMDGESDLLGVSDEENENEMDTEEAAAAAHQRDDSILTFIGHTNSSVICTRLNPVDNNIAVTGGQDDQALVWNTREGSIYFQCTGHTDTVVSVGFSHDGKLVATADMKGLIKVWKVETGTVVWSFDGTDLEWIQWHKAAPVLLAGTKEGEVWMWKIPSGDCKTFAGRGPSAQCGLIMPDGKTACVGYEDGVVKIWDLKSSSAIHTVSDHEGHKEPVFCLDHNSSGSLVMTGSEDMTAKVINTSTGKVVSTLACQKTEEDEDSVEAVGFSHLHDYATTGTLGGALEIWDLPTKSVRHRCEHPHGIVKIVWSKVFPTFFTSCLDGNIRQFDSRNGEMVRTWQGHRAAILDFDLSRDESLLVTASDDSTAKVFHIQ